jgi:hypothetical protein
MNLLFDDVDIFEDDFDILEIIDIGFPRLCCGRSAHFHVVRKIPWSLFTLTTSGIFAFFLARQPQGVLLDRFPPFKPCANEFSLPFSYIKTLARP